MEKENINFIWNVYKENFSRNCIEIYNVFDHVGFRSECEHIIHECIRTLYLSLESAKIDVIDKPEEEDSIAYIECINKAKEKIRIAILYYFGMRSECEIILDTHIHRERFNPIKIDIMDQLNLNFEQFFDYVFRSFNMTYQSDMDV